MRKIPALCSAPGFLYTHQHCEHALYGENAKGTDQQQKHERKNPAHMRPCPAPKYLNTAEHCQTKGSGEAEIGEKKAPREHGGQVGK